MLPVILTRIKTRDGITLDGIYVKTKRKSNTALIWVHGLTSYFYSSPTLIQELSSLCSKSGIGYFKFNNRGHDVVVRGQRKHKLLGTTFENFKDSVHDIRAMINFSKRLGYQKIILAGHSTGANKAVYYLYKTRDRRVKGLALVAGLNDIIGEIKRVGRKEFQKTVRLAQKLNKKAPHTLFMSKGFLFTARRYLGLHTPGTAEDVFPYNNPGAGWKELRSLRTPIAVVIGSRDEHLGMRTKKFIEIFRNNTKSAKSFSGFIIKGAGHSFHGKENELTKVVIDWVKKI